MHVFAYASGIAVILALAAWFMAPRRYRAAALASVGLICLIAVSASIVYFLSPDARAITDALLWPRHDHAVLGAATTSVSLPLPARTALRFRTSEASARYFTVARPRQVREFYLELVARDDATVVSEASTETVMLVHYQNGEYRLRLSSAGRYCSLFWVEYLGPISGQR